MKNFANSVSTLLASVVSLSCAVAGMPAEARTFTQALPGYTFAFPRDHASHDDYRTEWWYFTGHLKADNGKTYGYELTFFRTGLDQDESSTSRWNLRNIYLAHFAITDIAGKKFFYQEKMNRAGLNFAGAAQDRAHVFNENWSMDLVGNKFALKAVSPEYSINLVLNPTKPIVVHGKNGVSQKASCKGCASHYYSLTRLQTTGTISAGGSPSKVSGLTWMDHEFGSNQLTEKQVGWDWYSIQLNNNYDLMLYVMRNADGTIDPNSSGTIVGPDGKTTILSHDAYRVKPSSTWTSGNTKAKYPMGWHVTIPEVGAELDVNSVMNDQELVTKGAGVTYWEGASSVSGIWAGKPVSGDSYVEMTGYSEKFKQRI